MKKIKLLLYPFAMIYGFVVLIINKLYDLGMLKQKSFDFPVISVGNLSVGGTGKTPHVEYLIKLLKKDFKVATLSRGYKRRTKGFYEAGMSSTVHEIGDESVQKKQKFPDITVAVDENRVRGIRRLIQAHPETEAVILDDAFQHRRIKPGLNILLTDFFHPYTGDFPLPAGTLREFRCGAKRADIIVVTKTHYPLSPITVRRFNKLIKPGKHQKLYFSYLKIGELTPVAGLTNKTDLPEKINTILVFAGIANMYHLIEQVKKMANSVEIIRFRDHHVYTARDLSHIKKTFENIYAKNKIIVTTEKDAMRLFFPEVPEIMKALPVFYLPVEVAFHKDFDQKFNQQITDYVRANSRNGRPYQTPDGDHS